MTLQQIRAYADALKLTADPNAKAKESIARKARQEAIYLTKQGYNVPDSAIITLAESWTKHPAYYTTTKIRNDLLNLSTYTDPRSGATYNAALAKRARDLENKLKAWANAYNEYHKREIMLKKFKEAIPKKIIIRQQDITEAEEKITEAEEYFAPTNLASRKNRKNRYIENYLKAMEKAMPYMDYDLYANKIAELLNKYMPSYVGYKMLEEKIQLVYLDSTAALLPLTHWLGEKATKEWLEYLDEVGGGNNGGTES